MPSSTSSFERVIPGSRWGRAWFLSLALFCLPLGSLEILFRLPGHRPSIIDNVGLWSLHRNQVHRIREKVPVVLLGGSRMQLGFVPGELQTRYPRYEVVQLAIDGTASPVAALRDLASDETFRGVVLCAMSEWGFQKSNWDAQAPYVTHYHNQFNLNTALNTRISCYLHDRIVLMHPTLRLDDILLNVVKHGSLPAPFYVQTFADRTQVADYSMVDTAGLRKARIETLRRTYAAHSSVSPEQWLSDAAEIEPYVRRIQSRGGNVVFIRFPTTAEHWECDDGAYPKAQYWDAFARQTSAETVHFKDFPELSCFDCPDTSHLDHPDAVLFTQAIIRILESRHVIGP